MWAVQGEGRGSGAPGDGSVSPPKRRCSGSGCSGSETEGRADMANPRGWHRLAQQGSRRVRLGCPAGSSAARGLAQAVSGLAEAEARETPRRRRSMRWIAQGTKPAICMNPKDLRGVRVPMHEGGFAATALRTTLSSGLRHRRLAL